jgi:BirA family transcriptional regulator, biotin operon repressor / biotin---[acetyl-CoA-carboxylase] ligase
MGANSPVPESRIDPAFDRRMDRVLLSLSRNMTVPVSGEKLAAELGCSHSSLVRIVEKLRRRGVEIQGEPFAGFRLMRLPDVILPEHFAERRHTGQFGREIHHLYEVDSTNLYASRLLSERDRPRHGTLVLAEAQTAGKGRLGRRWVSAAGEGLYLTLVLCPRIPSNLAPLMTLAAAVAAHESVERVTGLDVDIKWPNDLLVGRKKITGILCELHAELDRVNYVTVGIGINVNQTRFPPEIREIATSLGIESGRKCSRVEVLLDFLATFERLYTRFEARGPEVVTGAWSRASSFNQGREIEVHDGVRTIRGVTDGLSGLGALRIRTAEGSVEEVSSGDVIAWA